MRVRTFLKAKLVFNDGNSSFDAVIRDLSDTGARLQIGNSVALPDRFDLYIAKKDETRRARIRWRTDEEMGVAFEENAAATPASPEVMRRISELEAEIEGLRHQMEELRAALGESRQPSKLAS
jgi:hypothetical protein